MEKKVRATHRTAFTKTIGVLNAEIAKDVPDLTAAQATFAVLTSRMKELENVDKLILDDLFDKDATEAELDAEIQAADEYKTKCENIKIRVASAVQNLAIAAVSRNIGDARATVETGNHSRKFKYPKVELRKFGGDPKEWLKFWSFFKKIYQDNEITLEEKFDFLIQSMIENSRASEYVNSFPPTAENYPKVIKGLESRFGRKDLLVEVYMRELLSMVLSKTKTVTLSSVYDKLETHIRSLESLGVATDTCAAMLFPLVESSLPEEILRVWQRKNQAGGDARARLDSLMTFLEEEVHNEERIQLAKGGFPEVGTPRENTSSTAGKTEQKGKGSSKSNNSVATAAGLLAAKDTNASAPNVCIFCQGSHDNANCEKAKNMSLESRQAVAREKHVCFACLKAKHNAKNCRSKIKCQWCGGRHALLICRKIAQNKPSENKEIEVERKVENLTLTNSSASCSTDVYLQTLKVRLRGPGGEQIVRALIDPGSHKSYVLKGIAEKMHLEVVGQQTMVHLLFGGAKTEPREHRKCKIFLSNLDGSYECCMTVYHEDVICQNLPAVSIGPWSQALGKSGIILSDTKYNNEPISLLLGADVVGRLYTGKIVQLRNGPTALETKLGWTLMGRTDTKIASNEEDTTLSVFSMFCREAKLSDLWELDILGITDPVTTTSKEAHLDEVKRQFLDTIKINEEGRYEVNLMWKENHPSLSGNRAASEKRLYGLTRKLNEQGLYNEYEKVFDNWLQEAIIERVDGTSESENEYYLPHRHVVKLNSTTRIRPVFDASAKNNEGFSLNQCLEAGPNLLEIIPHNLLRFRENEIGVISDIERAFLQVGVTPSDRDALKFLWWSKSEPRKIIVYRHRRVVFGVNSSPFLLNGTIEYHLMEMLKSTQSPVQAQVIKKLLRAFYVDNCVSSVQSRAERQIFQQESIMIMKEANFNLRGWEYTGGTDGNEMSLVLGICWDKSADLLFINVNVSDTKDRPVTKREILSAAHKIFDPLGWVCPTLLLPKLILQKLWSENMEWDSEVPDGVATEFNEWLSQVPMLKDIKVPRWIFGERSNQVTLHMFVDASKLAYAAVLFISVEKLGSVEVNLVQAKSRVGPKKEISIPRMELLAATLGARLLNSVLKAFDSLDAEVIFWSDSSTVLSWLRHGKQWSRFVWNRVEEVKRLTNVKSWRHVPGTMNPADLPSRGCMPSQLVQSRWWEGPNWLKLPQHEWPEDKFVINEEEVNAELCKSEQRRGAGTGQSPQKTETCQDLTCTNATKEDDSPWYLFNCSEYHRITRIMAWILRFKNNTRCLKNDRQEGKKLTINELDIAEKIVFRLAQQDSFNGSTDQRLKNLNVYLDELNLLRTKTLVSNRLDSQGFKYPVVLDRNHVLTKILIKFEHENLKHAGISTTMCSLREKVWIIQSRRAVRSVINQCTVCRRYSAKCLDVPPASLPVNRVRDADVFEVTGVDYAGPLYLRDGKKAWVCLFTCAVYRAVHLELVTSLSTTTFIEALRRFIARRGRPLTIYSDNGTNFVGANNLLKTVDWEKVNSYCSVKRIEWRFNPPSAPWWGGWWKRVVRILKDLLRRSLGKASLDYQEMITVLCECEAVLNARPLTKLTEDDGGLLAITPGMFLKEIRDDAVPDLDYLEKTSLSQRYKYLQRLRQELRNRFRIEYLGQLSKFNAVKKVCSTIKEGDIVLVANDTQKRLDWPLARVFQLIPGNDGTPRLAKLKTSVGELVRPLQRLILLESVENAYIEKTNDTESIRSPRGSSPIVGEENTSVEKNNLENDSNAEPHQADQQIVHEDCAGEPDRRTRSGRAIKTPKRFL